MVIILAAQLIYHLNHHYYNVLISTLNHLSLLSIAVVAITEVSEPLIHLTVAKMKPNITIHTLSNVL